MNQVGMGLVPHRGLETPQPEGKASAGVEHSTKEASLEPCGALTGAFKPEEEVSEGMEALQKTSSICQAPEAEEEHPGLYLGPCGAHPVGSL